MKVQNVKSGDVMTGADCWKHAFPMHECKCKPVDSEAVSAVEDELRKLDKPTRERVLKTMESAGTYPVKLEAVPERPALRTNESAKSGKA